jgi:hypothetical protein
LGRDSPNIVLVRISASRAVREKVGQTIFLGHQLTFSIEQTLKNEDAIQRSCAVHHLFSRFSWIKNHIRTE